MPDPLQLEREFRRVQHLLARPGSPRSKLIALARFMESAADGADALEPYLPETAQHLVVLADGAMHRGCDPRSLRALLRALSTPEALSLQSEIPGLRAALDRLDLQADLSAAWAGDIPDIPATVDGSGTPRERLAAEIAGAPATDRLRRIGELWDAALRLGPLETLVPVVDRTTGTGDLRKVRLTPVGVRPGAGDEIHVDAAVYGVHEPGEQLLARPLAAARALAGGRGPARRGLVATVVFEGAHLLHEGRSAELALAALLTLAYRRTREEREEMSLQPDCCLTGAVDEAGNVLPVDAGGLAEKLRAVFFSPAAVFVVPRDQGPLVERHLAGLTAAYPRRGLTLLGVSHVRELLFDRRITEVRTIPWIRYSAARAWGRRRSLAVGVLLVLLLVIARLVYGPLDREIVRASFSGTLMNLENRSGEVVDAVEVGAQTVMDALRTSGGADSKNLVELADVNGDGLRDVLWLRTDGGSANSATLLSCRITGAADSGWSTVLRLRSSFPGNPDVVGDELRSQLVRVADADGNGRPEAYLLARHVAFPGVLLQFDARSGEKTGEYLHVGHLIDLQCFDLNGDGVQEVLAAGLNNALRSGVLVVFDPRSITGSSPTTEDYRVEGWGPGSHTRYVEIPRTVVGEAFAMRSKSNIPYAISIDADGHGFVVWVLDVRLHGEFADEHIVATMMLHFGPDLRIRRVQTGDDYDLVYDRLRAAGKIPDVPRAAYLARYADALR